MSDEEIEFWRINVLEKSIDLDSTEWHRRALLAMQSSIRREILMLLKDKALTIDEIKNSLKLEEKAVQFHLQFLKQTSFITIERSVVDLTLLGVVYLKCFGTKFVSFFSLGFFAAGVGCFLAEPARSALDCCLSSKDGES